MKRGPGLMSGVVLIISVAKGKSSSREKNQMAASFRSAARTVAQTLL